MLRSALAATGLMGALWSSCVVARSPAPAGSQALIYKAAPAWVVPPPVEDDATTPSDAPLRFVYLDNQVRIEPDGTEEIYTAYRIKILKPEGLPAGNITAVWQPGSGSLTVHSLQLTRDGKTTDVLATTKFTVLQREAQLEQSMLDGQRTATLQVPGLQVGDEIAFAVTVTGREPIFGGKVAGLMTLPVLGSPGVFRNRLIWPADGAIRLQTTKDLGPVLPSVQGGERVAEVVLRHPDGALPTDGAPPRNNVRRLIEFSDFGNWADVGSSMAPAFENAAVLAPGSPVQSEVAAIVAKTQDPSQRALAALELVESRIRYVFIGLDGGNYIPAAADVTWQRRFGDCKAKSVLLVAILRAMGIEAEAVLVNSRGGDGLDERLPNPQLFDHAVVRAMIGGKPVWLDGTRMGDHSLQTLPVPWRWALPLATQNVGLEHVAPRDVAFPQITGIYDIDATAGFDKDAKVSIRTILRGDEAFALDTNLAALSTDDRDRQLKAYWRQQADWLTPDNVSWSYDDKRMALSLAVTGRGNPGWKGDTKSGHSLTILGAGFYAPDAKRRPADQDQHANWSVTYPRFHCWATTIHLPPAGPSFRWSLYADTMNVRLGGVAYWRASGMKGNIVRTVMSTHSYEPEASPREAVIVNQAIPNFNNNMSSIAEEMPAEALKALAQLPFGDDVDWLAAPAICSAPQIPGANS